jgi:mannose-1-phosphate guanylyltransferase
MKALVLAAGLGERVRPLTEKIPKPMLEVGGRPLIHYPLTMLKQAGITDVAINLHHLGEQIERGLREGKPLGIDITFSPEPVLFGTGGPLNALRDYLGDETFVVANSDGILDLDLRAMIAMHRERGSITTLALYPTDSQDAHLDAQSRIRRMRLLRNRNPIRFEDFPRELTGIEPDSLTRYRYCGAIVMEPAVFELMPKSPPWGIIDSLIAPMVADGLPVFGFVHRGYFRTVDDLSGYKALRREFDATPPRFQYLAF